MIFEDVKKLKIGDLIMVNKSLILVVGKIRNTGSDNVVAFSSIFDGEYTDCYIGTHTCFAFKKLC